MGEMRCAILADIHANLTAFEAVLADIERRGGVAEIWCLGDVVGYGPDPHQCVELLRHYCQLCVAGNHDWAAICKIDTAVFNPPAAAACRWTGEQLDSDDASYLENLPLVIQKEDFTLVHGSPREPIWEYLLTPDSARENFACFETRFCLIGHSHVPLVFELLESGSCSLSRLPADTELELARARLVINPGSVGQPRDGDPRASYALYDSETSTISFYRIPYDIGKTQDRMVRAGLPMSLVARLDRGPVGGSWA